MSNLASRIERLNHQADEIIGLIKEQTAKPVEPNVGTRSDFMPAAPFYFLAAMRAVRQSLVDLPDSYYERQEDAALIACKCRRGARVPLYNFHECGCGRVFCVTHRSVKVLPLEQPEASAA